MLFQVVEKPIETSLYVPSLKVPSAGGFVAFEGWVRDHHLGKEVDKLVYSAYVGMANKVGERIVQTALETFTIERAVCIHRVGELSIGDLAVWVGVSAGHRGAAFSACKYIIDTIKEDVPIWKHEFYKDGSDEWTLNHHCGA